MPMTRDAELTIATASGILIVQPSPAKVVPSIEDDKVATFRITKEVDSRTHAYASASARLKEGFSKEDDVDEPPMPPPIITTAAFVRSSLRIGT